MKVTPRFLVRAALVVTAGGVIGAFGACKDSNGPPPPPPPPPGAPVAPAAPTAQAMDSTKVSLTWTYDDATVTGFNLGRCQGAGCTDFAKVNATIAGAARAYTDTGLAKNTAYSYRLQAVRGADTSAWSPGANVTTGTTTTSGSITMIGAGEITTCASVGTSQTAALVQHELTANPTAIVFTVGNNLADTTSPNRSYVSCFDGSWGKFKPGMRATLGKMDFASV